MQKQKRKARSGRLKKKCIWTLSCNQITKSQSHNHTIRATGPRLCLGRMSFVNLAALTRSTAATQRLALSRKMLFQNRFPAFSTKTSPSGPQIDPQELRWIQNELPKHMWDESVRRRLQGEPLQYILGNVPFGNLTLKVRPKVFIPRWETEEWVLELTQKLKHLHDLRVIDVCTGTGAIALSIAHELPRIPRVVGVDLNPSAVQLAQENLATNFNASSGRVQFCLKDLFQMVQTPAESYNLVVSNPPYITKEEFAELPESVVRYEPHLALVGDTEYYEALVQLVLRSGADAFVFEMGEDAHQAEFVKSILNQDWSLGIWVDSSGRNRCVVGHKLHNKSRIDLSSMCTKPIG